MEAALLATYPGLHLPEQWKPGPDRDPAAPSIWRLARLVRHLPPDSAVARSISPPPDIEWTSMHQVVDDLRRYLAQVLGVKETPPPHPMSPFRDQGAGQLTVERRAVLQDAKERAEAREAELVRHT